MFREYATPTHLASYLAGLATAILIAVLGWLVLQSPAVVLPAAAPRAQQSSAASAEIVSTEAAADISAARWLAMARFYEENGLLTRDPFDYERAADISAARWLAMGKAYERMGLLNER
jgi:hypothetical protein